jgi:hypothetical protein
MGGARTDDPGFGNARFAQVPLHPMRVGVDLRSSLDETPFAS